MPAIYLLALSPIFVATVGFFLPRTIYKHALIAYQLGQVALVFHVFHAARTNGAIVERIGLWPRGVGITLLADYVSAMLSGVQVKAGVYLYLRLQAVYQPYIDTTSLFRNCYEPCKNREIPGQIPRF